MWGKGNSHDEQKIPAYRITNTFYVVEKHLYTIKKSFYLLNLDEIRCKLGLQYKTSRATKFPATSPQNKVI